jgi:hypothetical protein
MRLVLQSVKPFHISIRQLSITETKYLTQATYEVNTGLF